jgi:hypothetical protein
VIRLGTERGKRCAERKAWDRTQLNGMGARRGGGGLVSLNSQVSGRGLSSTAVHPKLCS